jgi:hypothetical protein
MMVCLILAIEASFDKHILIKGAICTTIGTILMTSVSYFTISEPMSISINMLIAFFVIKILTNKDFSSIVTIFLFSLSFILGFQFIVAIVLDLILNDFEYNFKYGLISQSFATISLLMTVYFIPFKSLYSFIHDRNKVFHMIIVNIFFIYYVLLMVWYIDLNGFLESILAYLLIIILILVINVVILHNGLQNQAAHEKMKIYDTYLPVIEAIVEDIRLKQHDYHNQLQTLSSIKENGLTSKTLERYEKELRSETIWSKLIKIDNKILMAFLYSKYKEGEKEGIDLSLDIRNYLLKSSFTDYELVDIFGIVIDNAYEAVRNTPHQFVNLRIDYREGVNIIEISNPSDFISSDDIRHFFEYHYSSKEEDGHGIGLYKLQKMLKKNSGNIIVHYDTTTSQIIFKIEIPT